MENLYLAFSDTTGNVWLTRINQDTGNAIGTAQKILTPPQNHSYSVIGMAYNAKMDTMYLSLTVGNTNQPLPPKWNLFAINKFNQNIHRCPQSLSAQLILTSNTLIRGIAYNNDTIYGINNNNVVYLIDVNSPNLDNSVTLTSMSPDFGNSINLAISDNTLFTFETPNGSTSLFSFDLDNNIGDNRLIIGYPNNYNYIYSPPGIYSLTANKHGNLYGIYINATESSSGLMFLAKYDRSSPFVITQVSPSPIVNLQNSRGALAFVPSKTKLSCNRH